MREGTPARRELVHESAAPGEVPGLRRSRPDLTELAALLEGPLGIRSLALVSLFVLGFFYTLFFARAFFLPVVLALHLNFLLSPVVRALKSARIPEGLGAGLVLLALLAATFSGFYLLSAPAAEWMARLPGSLRSLEEKLRTVQKPVEEARRAAEQVERLTKMDGGKRPQTTVEVKGPGLIDVLLRGTQHFLGSAAVMFLLLYFLLASGDLFLRKLIKVLPRLAEKKRAVKIIRETEQHISTYLATVTLMNGCLGVTVGAVVFVLGMPNPVLWGVMAGLLNFIPFLGPFAGLITLALVASLTIPDLGRALLVPGIYFGLHTLETNLITPLILGRRLTLNPVAIFLWLFLWYWLWGIPGAFLAVPMLATFKIFCDHIEPLSPVGEFLGR